MSITHLPHVCQFLVFNPLLNHWIIFPADGDPHFQVHLPKLEKNLCFTIDGHASDVLRLLEDAENGTPFS